MNIKRSLERIFGIHITPVHFYSPIPDIRELPHDIYTKVNKCEGMRFDRLEFQRFIDSMLTKYGREFNPYHNSGLSKVDSFVLYSLIRESKPKKMVEIGSGESTKIALLALEKNRKEGYDYHMTAIEPYPKEYLRKLDGDRFRLLVSKVQDVSLEEFSDADILFIDSSHVSKIGSDVNYEMFDILPTMKAGSLIHWHDIVIPVDYPRSWIENGNMYWNESYVVQSFMMYNESFETIWPSKYMQVCDTISMKDIVPFFEPENPDEQLSSFWIRRVK